MKKFLFPFACLLLSVCAGGQNPYLPLWEFIPDGEPHVFEDPDAPGKYRVYIYGSHDMLGDAYCCRDQVLWSASVDDVFRWRYDGVIFRSERDAQGNLLHEDGSGDILYAPDVCEVRNPDGSKTYYFYPNVQDPQRSNLVAKADRPDGPFVPCNWSPKDPRRTEGILSFDPAVFVDDDGRVYAYWGFCRSYCAELDPTTMATVKPGTRIIEDMIPAYTQDNTFRFFEASSMRKIADKYVFIYSRWTNHGEFGLPTSNYTLAYCYSNSPTGPWTYGGTIIDGRGRRTLPDGSTVATAVPFGNTHGSICRIGDKWWVFYHRQAGESEYSRQAVVAPVNVEVVEGESGYVRISEAEFTSEGFAADGLDPLQKYPAGIACHFTGPEPAVQEYPDVHYSGSHIGILRNQWTEGTDPYALECNFCPVVHNTPGSVVGYKYFNFSRTFGGRGIRLDIDCLPQAGGRIDVYLDAPCEAEGGVKIGSLKMRAGRDGKIRAYRIRVPKLRHYNGKHSVYLTFSSTSAGESVCRLDNIGFSCTHKGGL